MDEFDATQKADLFIVEILRNQPGFWPTGGMANQDNAASAAKNLASFRRTLIQELMKPQTQ